MSTPDRFRLPAKAMRWKCNPEGLGFDTTDDFECEPHIIGQDRALAAMRLGLEMNGPGYNVYVSGLTGTGKTEAVRRVLARMDHEADNLTDICFIANFEVPENPRCLIMPAGNGLAFKKRMSDLLHTIRELIPAVFTNERYKAKQTEILTRFKESKNDAQRGFEEEVRDKGFSLIEMDYGSYSRPELAPVIDGEVVSMEQLPGLLLKGKVGRGDFDKLQAFYPKLMEQLEEIIVTNRELRKELEQSLRELEREHLQPLVRHVLADVREAFPFDKVSEYLNGLDNYIMEHLRLLYDPERDAEPSENAVEFAPFKVNVVVSNAGSTRAPVVVERAPSYANLFGTIERHPGADGEPVMDFTGIRAGSLLRANGGFLIVNIYDLFEEPFVWYTFKRALKNQSYVIRSFDTVLLAPVSALKPEEIALDVKIVLIGDEYSYRLLHEYDEDFGRIFKVKSEFDEVMPNRRSNVKEYCQFIKNLCLSESLLPFHKSAAAAVVEQGVRRAGRQDRISTQFSEMGDIVREAAYWASESGARMVRAAHVDKAIEERTRRVNLYEDRMQEYFKDGTILIDIRGAKVGQVNGLAAYDLGDYSFGRPSRITVETSVGRAGVINIERESDMSGRLHNKGVHILEGYLRRMYAQDKPITMTASICFEQAYSGVDGDSASSTEVYALLSSLSHVPIRQSIAVTGSVNQKGEVQPIGAVNEKIEGFFDVCREAGLTGDQGVMIPALNKKDLMLRKDIVAAIAAKKFHVYAVRTIDQGIETLTGLPAGRRLRSGRFTRGSVHDRVDGALRRFHNALRSAEEGPDDKSGN